MPNIIYTKKAMKNIKSLDVDTIIIDAVLPRSEAYKEL